MRVLIVDNDVEILDLLKEEFNFNGYAATIVTTTHEAIGKLKTKKFDAVISEYNMPSGHGMRVLAYINSMKKRPIFFFATGHMDVNIENCLAEGACGVFEKPFDFNLLVCAVHQNLSQKI